MSNEFLPFAVGSGANVESQTDWATDAVVSTGFQSGTANSAQVNKAIRQASIIASMIAQFVVDNSGQNATDDGTTATLETNLTAAINALITAFVANALGSGGTIYSPDFASVSTDALDSGGASIRMQNGNYGVILRNDGGSLYVLLTNSGNASGAFNSLRPFSINLATGAVSIDGTGVGATFGGPVTVPSATITGNETVYGSLSVGGNESVGGTLTANEINTNNETVYGTLAAGTINATDLNVGSSATGPTPATGNRSSQLATTQCFANEFASSISGLNGYQKLPTGLIIQWGTYGTAQSGSPTTLNFPIAFPHGPLALCSTDDGLSGASSVHITSVSAISASQFVAYANNPATNAAANTNIGWIAIGY